MVKIQNLFSLLVGIILCLIILSPLTAGAADPFQQVCTSKTANSAVCQSPSDNPVFGPNGVVTKVTQIVAEIVGVAAVIMILISGLRFVTADNPEGVSGARKGLIFALIGVVVALFAQAIVFFVLRKL